MSTNLEIEKQNFKNSILEDDLIKIKYYIKSNRILVTFLISGEQPLYIACQEGKYEIAEYLLKKDADPNSLTLQKKNPLYISIQNNQEKIVELLLEHKVIIKGNFFEGQTLFELAVKNKNVNILKNLIEYDLKNEKLIFQKPYTSTFLLSVEMGQLEIIKYLLKIGFDYDYQNTKGESILIISCIKGHFESLRYLSQYCKTGLSHHRKKHVPFIVAAMNGHVSILKYLLSLGVPIDIKDNRGQSALCVACKHRKPEVVKFLISNDCDLNCISDDGRFPLYTASRNNYLGIVKMLLDKKNQNTCSIDLNLIFEGWTSLMIAIQNGNLEIVKCLLATNNCDLEIIDEIDGTNALMIAIENSEFLILNELLKYKPNLNIKTEFNESLLHLACSQNNLSIINLLLDHKMETNLKDENSFTPLMTAAENDQIEVIKFLFSKGIEIHPHELTNWEPNNLTNKEIKNLILSYDSIQLDFANFFDLHSQCDLEIKSNYGGSIPIHKDIVCWRLDKSPQEIQKVLQCFELINIGQFLKWVYSGLENFITDKEIFLQILNLFNINYQIKKGKLALVRDLKNLWKNNQSKDFSILIKQNQKIKVHKCILMARSKLFFNLFQFCNDGNINTITDFSKKTLQSMKIFLKFLYTDKIKKINSQIYFDELIDCNSFYQLNKFSSFDLQLNEQINIFNNIQLNNNKKKIKKIKKKIILKKMIREREIHNKRVVEKEDKILEVGNNTVKRVNFNENSNGDNDGNITLEENSKDDNGNINGYNIKNMKNIDKRETDNKNNTNFKISEKFIEKNDDYNQLKNKNRQNNLAKNENQDGANKNENIKIEENDMEGNDDKNKSKIIKVVEEHTQEDTNDDQMKNKIQQNNLAKNENQDDYGGNKNENIKMNEIIKIEKNIIQNNCNKAKSNKNDNQKKKKN
ncbi:ankyrin repeat-containing protein [Anaeramoeba flamelloides]|uniref:Ankyrin repeat-containing protein n=1 Tax=Anaeramoeba flamelloides TaxID=1746091 RepID=A0AAV7ZE92_9EUKA|nr:ankyrin repeat-containing protein [Anaeramoeba flamelloides]